MTPDQKTKEEIIAEVLAEEKPRYPPEVFAFIETHEHDLALDRKQAVYACRTEDSGLIEESKKEALWWINQAISWAEFVKGFGDYETREEFHHGTEEEWAFQVEKADEWIHLLTVWRDSFKEAGRMKWPIHNPNDFVFIESDDWQVADDEFQSTLDERISIQVCLHGGFSANVWRTEDTVTHLPPQPSKIKAILALNAALVRWNKEAVE
jgi:hypothetical protein